MTTPRSLAEVVEEGERLEALLAEAAERGDGFDWRTAKTRRDAFYVEHGPRLLAASRAAMEMRAAETEGRVTCRAPYAHGPVAVHRYGCPCTRIGKRYGSCDCGGGAVCARIVASRAAWDAAASGEEKPR